MRGFGAEHSNILSVLQLGNVSYMRVIFVFMTSYRGHFQPVGDCRIFWLKTNLINEREIGSMRRQPSISNGKSKVIEKTAINKNLDLTSIKKTISSFGFRFQRLSIKQTIKYVSLYTVRSQQ